MSAKNNIIIYVVLIVALAIFLTIEYFTHIEFLLHVAAIPLEILTAVFIVGIYLINRQNKERRHQLMHIKSWMFRLEMRNLFITNFLILKSPPVTIQKIKASTLDELKKMREDANNIEYQSLESMESLILEYVNAEPVWRNFMNIALDYDFEDVFQDMVYIMHFISDVKTFKENNPGKLFICEAAKNKLLIQKVMKILGDGIRKYLEYAIELKEKQPDLFNEVISDYELSDEIRSISRQCGAGDLHP